MRADKLALLFAGDRALQQPLQQRQGLQRLAQIVAGGGEEVRLGLVGDFGAVFGGLQRVADALALGHVDEGDDHAFDAAGLRPIGQDAPHEPGAVARLDLAFDRQMLGQHDARVGQQRRVRRERGEVRQGTADIAGDDVNRRGSRG